VFPIMIELIIAPLVFGLLGGLAVSFLREKFNG
jgi:hypothetical protein